MSKRADNREAALAAERQAADRQAADRQAAEAAELRAALAELEARQEIRAAADRERNRQLLAEFREQTRLDRTALLADLAEPQPVPQSTAMTVPQPTGQPRDERGRWLPQQPEPEPEPPQPGEFDLGALSMDDYARLRGELGLDGRGLNNLGRAPGHERQEFLGHQLSDGSGFADWTSFSTGQRVYSSQLPDGSRRVPPGYMRRSAEQERWT